MTGRFKRISQTISIHFQSIAMKSNVPTNDKRNKLHSQIQDTTTHWFANQITAMRIHTIQE